MNISKIDLLLFFLQIIITIGSIYSTWVNLVLKRISRFGFDAFILLFFIGEKARLIREDPKLVKRMGIITMLISAGGFNEIVLIFNKIWHSVGK